jgi:hypothetical protein
LGVRPPFFMLQGAQAVMMFSHVVRPPFFMLQGAQAVMMFSHVVRPPRRGNARAFSSGNGEAAKRRRPQ